MGTLATSCSTLGYAMAGATIAAATGGGGLGRARR